MKKLLLFSVFLFSFLVPQLASAQYLTGGTITNNTSCDVVIELQHYDLCVKTNFKLITVGAGLSLSYTVISSTTPFGWPVASAVDITARVSYSTCSPNPFKIDIYNGATGTCQAGATSCAVGGCSGCTLIGKTASATYFGGSGNITIQ